jgi:hypothetical protein
MTYMVQPTRQPSPGPDIRVTGDASGAFIWVGVVLLVFAVALLFRPRGANGE